MALATVKGVKEGASKVTGVVDRLVADLVSLRNPVTASAVVGFVLATTHALGFAGISNEALLGVVVGVGVLTNVVNQIVSGKTSSSS